MSVDPYALSMSQYRRTLIGYTIYPDYMLHEGESSNTTPQTPPIHPSIHPFKPPYLAPTPFLAELGFFALFPGSLTPTAPLLTNLLLFRYSSTTPSTLPRSCFGFLI